MRGKVHLLAAHCLTRGLDRPSQEIWSRCCRAWSRRYAVRAGIDPWPSGASTEDRRRLVDELTFSALPRSIQCAYCHDRYCPRSATHADILSVAIFCGALAGALDAKLRALIADYIAHDRLGQADPSPLLDLAEQRGLHEGGYGPERYEEWQERDAHGTGDNPHAWLPVHAQPFDGSPSVPLPNADPQCTCGLRRSVVHGTTYRHDDDRSFERMHVGRDCWDLRCQRERGHAGPHRARWPLHGYGGIEEQIDEWGDVEPGDVSAAPDLTG